MALRLYAASSASSNTSRQGRDDRVVGTLLGKLAAYFQPLEPCLHEAEQSRRPVRSRSIRRHIGCLSAHTRGKRIAVSLAGPFASLIVAGCASLFAVFAPAESAGLVAWALAAFTHVATLWDLNPLLELDGYYVLADMLRRPNLRRDGAEAVCGRRRDPVALAYAIGALAYGAVVLFVIVPSLARATLVAWLPSTGR